MTIRLQPDLLAALDRFRTADPRGFGRPQAIRALMKMVLGSRKADQDRRTAEILQQHTVRRIAQGKDIAAR